MWPNNMTMPFLDFNHNTLFKIRCTGDTTSIFKQ